MKTCSNTNREAFKSPDLQGYLSDVMKDRSYDYSGIDENLKGESACHIMEPDEIYKTIKNKNENGNYKLTNLISNFLSD